MPTDTRDLARRIRRCVTTMTHRANASHVGGALSVADILAVLYGDVAKVRPADPEWPDRDRIIFSKGHCCTALYAALALTGFLDPDELSEYGRDDSRLMAHASSGVPGVELSTGSLGHGLPVAAGRALAAKRLNATWRTFAILSDGELDEGSNWEACLFAPHHQLDNLIAIVDVNRIQSLGTVSEVLELDPLADKFRAFRWAVREIDGHDHDALVSALKAVPWERGRPSCLLCHTVKGKGVDFMENRLLWHYKAPDAEQLRDALDQLSDS